MILRGTRSRPAGRVRDPARRVHDKFNGMSNVSPSSSGLRLWVLPIRLFHFAFAVTVVAAIACAKLGAELMDWHVRLGIVALALLVFRVAWGFVGPRTARFSQFVVSPAHAWRYLRHEAAAHGTHAGHNPLGGWSVIAMLLIIGLQATTGLFANDEISIEGPLARFVSDATSSALTGLHKFNEKPVFAILILHVLAIAIYTAKGQSLVRPMITGDAARSSLPPGTPETRDDAATRLTALLIATLAACGAWWLLSLA